MAAVLFVEDEIEVLCGIRQLKKNRMPDVTIREVRDVETFWKIFEEQQWDAILLDLILPPSPRATELDEMAGVIIAEELIRRNQKVPIVALTAWPETRDWRERLEEVTTVKYILKKPVSADELFDALQKAINRGRSGR